LEDELYVANKQVEQKDAVIETLSIRYDTEYSKFEDKIHHAILEKDQELEDMRQRLNSQSQHSDELEREIETLSRERLVQERVLREALFDRDTSRRNV
jgi:Skp family chaperone for outer membrane proteins